MQIAMTEAEFASVAERSKTQGIELSGRSGTIERMGVKASWAFDGSDLTVDVLKKPFFLSQETIEQKLREALS